MKNLTSISCLLLLLMLLYACTEQQECRIEVEEVSPWCIVPFDALERTPAERIAMLQELGFKKYGYNWREKHLAEMQEEFQLAQENDIAITSIFLWLNAKRDSLEKWSPLNQKMLSQLKEVEQKPSIWLSCSPNFFEDLNQEESIALAIELVKFVKEKADELGCSLALYNHRGWFGNPHNQVEIIKALSPDTLTMVYNFHHAHSYLEEFPEVVKKIAPYLSYVNLNGMKKEGPEILSIGAGDVEFEMISLLLEEGYRGPWGILGHIETEDVQAVLQRNIDGLNSWNSNCSK